MKVFVVTDVRIRENGPHTTRHLAGVYSNIEHAHAVAERIARENDNYADIDVVEVNDEHHGETSRVQITVFYTGRFAIRQGFTQIFDSKEDIPDEFPWAAIELDSRRTR